ncbi:MAG: glycosyltransferase [Phycisphaeraceae bacterium]|nr:glycosyltransferase [Phycisphaeraceae bacterium]
MRILMLGWEFPPKVTGGLAVATAGLVRALGSAGHEITLMLPESRMPEAGGRSDDPASWQAATTARLGISGAGVDDSPSIEGAELTDDDDHIRPWPMPVHPLLAVGEPWKHHRNPRRDAPAAPVPAASTSLSGTPEADSTHTIARDSKVADLSDRFHPQPEPEHRDDRGRSEHSPLRSESFSRVELFPLFAQPPDPYASFDRADRSRRCESEGETASRASMPDSLRPISFLGGRIVSRAGMSDSRHDAGDRRQAVGTAPVVGEAEGDLRWEESTSAGAAGDSSPGHRSEGSPRPTPGVSRSSDHRPEGVGSMRWLPDIDNGYPSDLHEAVRRYALSAVESARGAAFDVIHAHDWLTMPAAIALAAIHGKPMVVHIHSTEYDRVPEHQDPRILAIERRGMLAADRVVAVSRATRRTLIRRYGIPARKIEVVHNGIEPPAPRRIEPSIRFEPSDRLVVFIGRITGQKGPEIFVEAARRVLERENGVRFVMAGIGDMVTAMIERVVGLGLGEHFTFTGFLDRELVDRLLDRVDVFVMTSVREPFGLTPLEAALRRVPVILSRTAGVSEVLKHALKIDYWNSQEIADRILSVLRRPALASTLRHSARAEVRTMTWGRTAEQCCRIYRSVLGKVPRLVR